jgi:flagellar assembly protein FliH
VDVRPGAGAAAADGAEDPETRARAIVQEAQVEAVRIREEAEREAKERRASLAVEVEQALRDAREQGYSEGLAQAREEVTGEAREALGRIRRMAEVLFEERERAWREQERHIVDLAVHVAEKVVRRQVELDPEVVLRMAREAISRVTEKEHLVLRIHPEDLAVIEAYAGDLRERFRNLGQLQVEEDRHLSRGGCVVESRGGYIDATVEGQLHQVRRELGLEG